MEEGINITSQDVLDRQEQEERDEQALSQEAKTPVKVRVHKTEGTGLDIDWKDGHHSSWTFEWLRWACPCAGCYDEREKTGRKLGEPKPMPKPAAPAPTHATADPGATTTYHWSNPALRVRHYDGHPCPETVTPVGNYAVTFTWNDGHKSGIYSWNFLRRHCLCPECRAKRGE